MGAAHGGASLAFFVAGLIDIMIGLAYAEMASAYPGGGRGHEGRGSRFYREAPFD